MKHNITLITALLLAPLAAIHAADSPSLQPPQHIGKPRPEHTVTPALDRNRDSQSQALTDQGFEKVAIPEIPLFAPNSSANYCTLYQKDCVAGETILIGKWAVPLFMR